MISLNKQSQIMHLSYRSCDGNPRGLIFTYSLQTGEGRRYRGKGYSRREGINEKDITRDGIGAADSDERRCRERTVMEGIEARESKYRYGE
jgi:hypothetical protein